MEGRRRRSPTSWALAPPLRSAVVRRCPREVSRRGLGRREAAGGGGAQAPAAIMQRRVFVVGVGMTKVRGCPPCRPGSAPPACALPGTACALRPCGKAERNLAPVCVCVWSARAGLVSAALLRRLPFGRPSLAPPPAAEGGAEGRRRCGRRALPPQAGIRPLTKYGRCLRSAFAERRGVRRQPGSAR